MVLVALRRAEGAMQEATRLLAGAMLAVNAADERIKEIKELIWKPGHRSK
jgi:hypothetical protein